MILNINKAVDKASKKIVGWGADARQAAEKFSVLHLRITIRVRAR
jgi:hypothetical protein